MNGWWERDDLRYADDSLMFAGRSAADLAYQYGSPSFFYSARRVAANLTRLHAVLDTAGFAGRHRLNYAMKANRFAPLLTWMKTSGLCSIDACSPQEVEHAVGCGFSPAEISFTATSLSDRDFDRLSRLDGLVMNCDSLHSIRQWGERRPGRKIGIRVNPAVGVGRAHNEMLQYSGGRTTKFGIYREQFAEAVELAARYGLTIERIHFHTGCGYLTPQLNAWERVVKECLWFVDRIDTVTTVNVGGGLGVPHTAQDRPLDLAQWAAILTRHFQPRRLQIEVEPGDYLSRMADCCSSRSMRWRRSRTRSLSASTPASTSLSNQPSMASLSSRCRCVAGRAGSRAPWSAISMRPLMSGTPMFCCHRWHQGISWP